MAKHCCATSSSTNLELIFLYTDMFHNLHVLGFCEKRKWCDYDSDLVALFSCNGI